MCQKGKLPKQQRTFLEEQCTSQAVVNLINIKFRFLENFSNSLLKTPIKTKIRSMKTSLIVSKYIKKKEIYNETLDLQAGTRADKKCHLAF